MASYARMSDETKAHCYGLRHPPKGQKPMPYWKIAEVVKKTDGSHPKQQAVYQAVQEFAAPTPLLRVYALPG